MEVDRIQKEDNLGLDSRFGKTGISIAESLFGNAVGNKVFHARRYLNLRPCNRQKIFFLWELIPTTLSMKFIFQRRIKLHSLN